MNTFWTCRLAGSAIQVSQRSNSQCWFRTTSPDKRHTLWDRFRKSSVSSKVQRRLVYRYWIGGGCLNHAFVQALRRMPCCFEWLYGSELPGLCWQGMRSRGASIGNGWCSPRSCLSSDCQLGDPTSYRSRSVVAWTVDSRLSRVTPGIVTTTLLSRARRISQRRCRPQSRRLVQMMTWISAG